MRLKIIMIKEEAVVITNKVKTKLKTNTPKTNLSYKVKQKRYSARARHRTRIKIRLDFTARDSSEKRTGTRTDATFAPSLLSVSNN